MEMPRSHLFLKAKIMKQYFYSIDSGATWEGPFSQEEISNFKTLGIISFDTLIREEGSDSPPPQQTVTPAAEGADASYIVMIQNIPSGPFTQQQLENMVHTGAVLPSDMAWREGMSEWCALSAILPSLFSHTHWGSLEGFSLHQFFSQIFKRHTEEELLDCFIAGTRQGTPALSSVSTTFPSPWIFARIFLFTLLLYLGFDWACNYFGNPKLIPGLLFVGNFGIPFCIFLLFYELNVRRDVPLYKAIQALIGGGLISLIITLLLSSLTRSEAPIWAGPIEETAKLLAAILVAGRFRNGRILTGLLFGAAIGSGFAAFESAGYTFEALWNYCVYHLRAEIAPEQAQEALRVAELYFNPDEVMHNRALLSPFGHMIWTAISAGAYWSVLNSKIRSGQRMPTATNIDFSILYDTSFLRIAAIPVVLHMLWNSVAGLFSHYGHITIGVVGWIIVLRLVNSGLNQIKFEQTISKS